MVRPNSQSNFAKLVSNRNVDSGVTGRRKKSLYDHDHPHDQRCEDVDIFVVDRLKATCQLPPSFVMLIRHRASFPWCCDDNNYITVVWTPLFTNSNSSTHLARFSLPSEPVTGATAPAAGLSSFQAAKHHQKFDVKRHPEKAKATHKKMRAKDRPLENDYLSDEAFEKLLHSWFGNIARVLLPGRALYCWGGYANCANYPPVLKACGLYFSQAIIWDKQHPVLTRKDFMGAHEWCFYCWREGAAHKFFGPNNVTDVWSVKKINPQSMIHLTEKPVELAVRAIQTPRARARMCWIFSEGAGRR